MDLKDTRKEKISLYLDIMRLVEVHGWCSIKYCLSSLLGNCIRLSWPVHEKDIVTYQENFFGKIIANASVEIGEAVRVIIIIRTCS